MNMVLGFILYIYQRKKKLFKFNMKINEKNRVYLKNILYNSL